MSPKTSKLTVMHLKPFKSRFRLGLNFLVKKLKLCNFIADLE